MPKFDVTKYLGTYQGTWWNEAAGTSGDAQIMITADQAAKTAALTIDAEGNIVGLMEQLAGGAIPQMSYTGTITAQRLDADYAVSFADSRTADSLLRLTKQP